MFAIEADNVGFWPETGCPLTTQADIGKRQELTCRSILQNGRLSVPSFAEARKRRGLKHRCLLAFVSCEPLF